MELCWVGLSSPEAPGWVRRLEDSLGIKTPRKRDRIEDLEEGKKGEGEMGVWAADIVRIKLRFPEEWMRLRDDWIDNDRSREALTVPIRPGWFESDGLRVMEVRLTSGCQNQERRD